MRDAISDKKSASGMGANGRRAAVASLVLLVVPAAAAVARRRTKMGVAASMSLTPPLLQLRPMSSTSSGNRIRYRHRFEYLARMSLGTATPSWQSGIGTL